jgi:8-oxo-dGTP diphosphatase
MSTTGSKDGKFEDDVSGMAVLLKHARDERNGGTYDNPDRSWRLEAGGRSVPHTRDPICERECMTRFALQFGQTQPGLTYLERSCVYGLCPRGEQSVAIARIGARAPFEYDLPGGGIEADEDEAAALMREFGEETGLTVWPSHIIGRAGQFWVNRSEPRNSLSTYYEVELSATDGRPTEPDHELVWMAPLEAIMKVRHESHAWAIMHWLRQRKAKGPR